MADKKTVPLSREAIESTDTLLARSLLLVELCQIREFIQLWQAARQIPGRVIEVIRPRLKQVFQAMSAEGRGALLMGEKAYSLYDEAAVNEANEVRKAVMELYCISKAVKEVLQKPGIQANYQSSLEALVEPLGVPGLVDMMMGFDMKEGASTSCFMDR